jgi:hypothetical protein
MTSSQHGPYDLGYTRATMAGTKGSKSQGGANPKKAGPSSDCRLQLAYMKAESLVIADQHAAVNTFPGLVHTARHTTKAVVPEVAQANRKEAGPRYGIGDWGEVVTR